MNMITEDLFRYGVTPKEGKFAGEKFIVDAINRGAVICHREEDAKHHEELPHGTYDIWQEPKTIFEDHSRYVTWGEFKKAMEQKCLPDDTRFYTYSFGPCDANVYIASIDGKKSVCFF